MKIFFNKRTSLPLICYMIAIFCSCASHRVATTWKTQHITPVNYNRVLVVAILPDEDSTERDNIEKNFTNALEDLGYNAVSAVTEFGRKGLADLGEDETYNKLNNKGFDAVVTIALVNKRKETEHQPAGSYTSRNNFFYKRIFDYKKILTQPGNTGGDGPYFWESILFDLSRLEAATAVQTTSSSKPAQFKMGNDLAKHLIRRMVKEKTLKKQKPSKAPRPF